MFERSKYYSQTQVLKEFKISLKAFKQLIVDHRLEVVSKDVDLGMYSVKTVYIRKEDIDSIKMVKKL